MVYRNRLQGPNAAQTGPATRRRARRWPWWVRRFLRWRAGDPPTGADIWQDSRAKRLGVMWPERDRATIRDYLGWAVRFFPPGEPFLNVGSGGFSDVEAALGGRRLFRQDFLKCPGADFISDAGRLPFPAAGVGAAICVSVLEHAVDPAAILRELARVLRPGAPLYISVPCVWPIHRFPNDYWRFMPDGLLLLLGAAFRVGDMRGTGPRGNLPIQILCTASRA
ncbi:MAG: methyltransferase domain-containing protein [Planctomycetes bacterium]|nr:methyltransferase domain-containing protein [Planctomycetota bacterium]